MFPYALCIIRKDGGLYYGHTPQHEAVCGGRGFRLLLGRRATVWPRGLQRFPPGRLARGLFGSAALEPLDPQKIPELAQAVIQADRFPMLATIDGDQPCLRPVSPVKTDGFTVYVANLRVYHKTQEIEANPKVELTAMNPG